MVDIYISRERTIFVCIINSSKRITKERDLAEEDSYLHRWWSRWYIMMLVNG
jgi:hypothetical protein